MTHLKKTSKKSSFAIVMLFVLLGCNDDFDIPRPQNEAVTLQGNQISISSAKAGLNRLENNVITFSDNLIMDGYVISSDKGGNFFKELILQDRPENPTAGIHFLIDERSLHQRFPFGSKIQVQLNGLSVGFGNGVVKLGRLQEDEIVPLTAFEIDQHIFRIPSTTAIVPLKISISSLTREKESLFVKVTNMQFNKNCLEPTPKTLAAEPTDNFNGLRTMLNCEDNIELNLSTSTFSSFKTLTLPKGSGTIQGVLSRNFKDDFFVLKVNSVTDINFEINSRCDPQFFECNSGNAISNQLIFEENFETITNENLLDALGWINVNVTGDERHWINKKIKNINNRVLTISAFNTQLQPLEAWLITPEIDMTEVSNAFLQFRVRTQFNNGKTLQVWITNSFSGNPLTTNWSLLPVKIPVTSSNYKTIEQDISCLSGGVRVAFQYKGFDPTATSKYQIDDVKFYGNNLLGLIP